MGKCWSQLCYINYFSEKGEVLSKDLINSINILDNKDNYNTNIISNNDDRNKDNKNIINFSIGDYDLSENINNSDNLFSENIDISNHSQLVSRILENTDNLSPDKKRCTICLDNFQILDNIINLSCLHMFHENCIKKWLNENNFCPICKKEV